MIRNKCRELILKVGSYAANADTPRKVFIIWSIGGLVFVIFDLAIILSFGSLMWWMALHLPRFVGLVIIALVIAGFCGLCGVCLSKRANAEVEEECNEGSQEENNENE